MAKSKAKAAKTPVYPTKRTINLVPQKKGSGITPVSILGIIVGILLIAVFTKFAVIDVLGMGFSKSAELAAAEKQLAQLEEKNSHYKELQYTVAEYGARGLSVEERSLVNRGDVLSLLSSTVGSRTNLNYASCSGDTIELRFTNSSLSDVSDVVAALEGNSLVKSVTVDTTKTDNGSNVVTTVLVKLINDSSQIKKARTSTSEPVTASSSDESSSTSSEGGAQ